MTTIGINTQLSDIDRLAALLQSRKEAGRAAVAAGMDADGDDFLAVLNEVDEIGVTFGDEEWSGWTDLTFPVLVLLRAGE